MFYKTFRLNRNDVESFMQNVKWVFYSFCRPYQFKNLFRIRRHTSYVKSK